MNTFFSLAIQLGEIGPGGRMRPESYVGAYFVLHGEFGRYRVPEGTTAPDAKILSTSESSLGTFANTELYMSIWQEIVNAYMDWNRPPVPGHGG